MYFVYSSFINNICLCIPILCLLRSFLSLLSLFPFITEYLIVLLPVFWGVASLLDLTETEQSNWTNLALDSYLLVSGFCGKLLIPRPVVRLSWVSYLVPRSTSYPNPGVHSRPTPHLNLHSLPHDSLQSTPELNLMLFIIWFLSQPATIPTPPVFYPTLRVKHHFLFLKN